MEVAILMWPSSVCERFLNILSDPKGELEINVTVPVFRSSFISGIRNMALPMPDVMKTAYFK